MATDDNRPKRPLNRRKDSKTTEDTNKRVKVIIKSDNKVIKKSINKRNIRKPNKYQSDSDSDSDSESDSDSDSHSD